MDENCGLNEMMPKPNLPDTLGVASSHGIIACSRVSSPSHPPPHHNLQNSTNLLRLCVYLVDPPESVQQQANQMSVCFQVLIFVEEMMIPFTTET